MPGTSSKEHIHVPHLWQRLTDPTSLFFPSASLATCTNRNKLNGHDAYCAEHLSRLAHARHHADLIVETVNRAQEEVRAQAVPFLERRP